MFSANTLSVVICLFAMLHMSDGKKKYGPKKSRVLEEANKSANVLPLTEEDKMEIVNAHNDIRSKVKPSAADMYKMVWNEEASINAMNYAAKCTDDHSDYKLRVIKNPTSYFCGENLFFTSAKTPWADVIKEWAGENEDFAYGEGSSPNSIVGHYTQVVWWNSEYCGCGAAKCDNMMFPYLYVCHYCPAGNDWNRRYKPYESGRRCSKCQGRCENGLCVNNQDRSG